MSDLNAQRQTILHTRENMSELGDNVSRAKHLLGTMSRRAAANRVLMYVGIGALVLMVIGAFYFGLKGEDEAKVIPGFQRSPEEICSGKPYTVNPVTDCNGWQDVTEEQCQQFCASNAQAERCPVQTCFALAFYPASGWCHLYTEQECAIQTAAKDVTTFTKAPPSIQS